MRGTHSCATGMRCENFPGSFRCIREKPCGTGYSVNVFTQECDGLNFFLKVHLIDYAIKALNFKNCFRY